MVKLYSQFTLTSVPIMFPNQLFCVCIYTVKRKNNKVIVNIKDKNNLYALEKREKVTLLRRIHLNVVSSHI